MAEFISSMVTGLLTLPRKRPSSSRTERVAATIANCPFSISTNSTRSPASTPSASRTRAGIVICPFEVIVAWGIALHHSKEYSIVQGVIHTLSYILAFRSSDRLISLKGLPLILQAQHRPDRTSAKRVREHLSCVRDHKPRIVPQHGRNMPCLHPALRLPAHELDFLGRQMLRPHNRRGAVVLLQALVLDE